MVMTRKKLIRVIDRDKIKEAIQKAEHRTSGEIRVSVAPFFWGNVHKAAEKAFTRLGMTRTKDHNAILFFVVPARRKFVVLGDSGIHERVGQKFWHRVVDVVADKFRGGGFTPRVFSGIEGGGGQLASHFPYERAAGVGGLVRGRYSLGENE